MKYKMNICILDPYIKDAFLRYIASKGFEGETNSSRFLICSDKTLQDGKGYETDFMLPKEWDEAITAIEELIKPKEKTFEEKLRDKILPNIDDMYHNRAMYYKMEEELLSLINEHFVPKEEFEKVEKAISDYREDICTGEVHKLVTENFDDIVENPKDKVPEITDEMVKEWADKRYPDGYYYLKEGDEIKEGDEYIEGTKWFPVPYYAPKWKGSIHVPHRRKINKEQPKEDIDEKINGILNHFYVAVNNECEDYGSREAIKDIKSLFQKGY